MTTVTIRIDQTLKSELQRLLSDLGMDMTTFLRSLQNRQ